MSDPGPQCAGKSQNPCFLPFLTGKQSKAVGICREGTVANGRTPLFPADAEAVGRHGSFKVFSNLH